MYSQAPGQDSPACRAISSHWELGIKLLKPCSLEKHNASPHSPSVVFYAKSQESFETPPEKDFVPPGLRFSPAIELLYPW